MKKLIPTLAEETFSLSNRKYLGSKKNLLLPLVERMLALCGLPKGFLDGFCGTGVVSAAMRQRGVGPIIAVDNLYCNGVILRGFFSPGVREPRALELLSHLNALPPREGYLTANFSGSYFTTDNCRRMDAAREQIEELKRRGEVSAEEYDYLLASFLLAADRVANTVGQYDAYLKHIGRQSVERGRHLLDSRVYSPFLLRRLQRLGILEGEIVTGDLLALLPHIRVEAAYFDPPYNTRQYCSNYHLLENIARWEKPQLHGKTRKFPMSGLKSPFSQKRTVREAFCRLVAGTAAAHLFISYNSEGLVSRQQLLDLLAAYGRVSCFEFPYIVFGAGAGVSRRRALTEYLFYLKK